MNDSLARPSNRFRFSALSLTTRSGAAEIRVAIGCEWASGSHASGVAEKVFTGWTVPVGLSGAAVLDSAVVWREARARVKANRALSSSPISSACSLFQWVIVASGHLES